MFASGQPAHSLSETETNRCSLRASSEQRRRPVLPSSNARRRVPTMHGSTLRGPATARCPSERRGRARGQCPMRPRAGRALWRSRSRCRRPPGPRRRRTSSPTTPRRVRARRKRVPSVLPRSYMVTKRFRTPCSEEDPARAVQFDHGPEPARNRASTYLSTAMR